MEWGKIVKVHREALNWSVADLSIKSGVKHGTIYQIERGQKNGGSIVIIEKLVFLLSLFINFRFICFNFHLF